MKGGWGARLALWAFVALSLFGFQAEANVVGVTSEIYGADLANAPDYNWWYGCSPTSSGMMMGYYDRNGYGGLQYGNLCPGGVAELTTFGIPNPSTALANNMIASAEHIADYWGTDSPSPHADNCLADFMETSQDPFPDGGTRFWFYNNGARMIYTDIVARGLTPQSGMYGMYEYVASLGYDVTQLYNQYTDNMGLTYGFTFEHYKDEIDAGRPVLVHVTDHTMLGYGYDDSGGQQLVTLNDTWTPGPHTMTWGGVYSNLGMFGVTVLELTGGDVPEPTILVGLVSMIPVGLVFLWRRRRK